MSRLVKDPVVEAYLAESLDSTARAQVEQVLASSPDDQARVAALRAESLAFLIQNPPVAFVAKLGVEKARAWWATPWAWLLLGALVAAGLAMFVIQGRGSGDGGPDIAMKGEQAPALTIHRRTEAGSEVLGADAVLHAGDEVRFSATAPRRGFVAVFAGDGLTALVPAAPVAMGVTLLDGAGTLDAAVGPERFVLVWSAEAFREEEARAAVRAGSTDSKWRIVRREIVKQ